MITVYRSDIFRPAPSSGQRRLKLHRRTRMHYRADAPRAAVTRTSGRARRRAAIKRRSSDNSFNFGTRRTERY